MKSEHLSDWYFKILWKHFHSHCLLCLVALTLCWGLRHGCWNDPAVSTNQRIKMLSCSCGFCLLIYFSFLILAPAQLWSTFYSSLTKCLYLSILWFAHHSPPPFPANHHSSVDTCRTIWFTRESSLLLLNFYNRGNWGSKEVSKLCTSIDLLSGSGRIWSKIYEPEDLYYKSNMFSNSLRNTCNVP